MSRLPLIWGIAAMLLLSSGFREVRWSYVDTARNIAAASDGRSLGTIISDSFSPKDEYRPMLSAGTAVAYRIIGLNLGTYKVIVGLEVALILAALVVMFRPAGWRRGVAACVALGVVLGLHTSQILLLFVPLNAYATSMLLVMAAALLAMTPRQRGYEWILLPLTLFALLWLEVGILIVPLVGVAWLLKAPGTTWRSVAASAAAVMIYLALRSGASATVALPYSDTGLGFSNISPAESAALFKHVPWLFWLHNAGVNLMTVLASEPRSGRFEFIQALLRGDVPVWKWFHVLSSIATTVVVFGAFAARPSRPHRDRLIAAFGAVLAVGGSALGFLYARDRIGLPIGIGYAMLVYVALSGLFDARGPKWRTAAVTVMIALLGVCWSLRTVEFYFNQRDTAWDRYGEWERPEALAAAEESPVLAQLRQSALKHRPDGSPNDPRWTYVLFQRRFLPQ